MKDLANLLFDNFFLLVLLVASAVFIVILLRTLAQTLFGLQHLEFARLERKEATAIVGDDKLRRVLLIDYSWKAMQDLRRELTGDDHEYFDLSLRRKNLMNPKWRRPAKKHWIVVGLESILMNQEMRVKALDLLEELASDDSLCIYFFSEVSPLARLRQAREREKQDRRSARAGSEGGSSSSQAFRESFRWSNLFADFTTLYGDRPPHEIWPSNDFVDEILNREFALVGSTKVYAQRLAARETARSDDGLERSPVSRESVIAYLANFLGDYYQRQWLKSTKEERMAMHHLANGRYINASNFIVLDNLLLRGLVRRDPDFQLMNESFAYWIRMLDKPEWFEEFRIQSERGGTWHFMRAPLLLAIVSSVTILAYLDRGGSGSLLTLLPAVAAGVPLLLTQFSQARQNIPG